MRHEARGDEALHGAAHRPAVVPGMARGESRLDGMLTQPDRRPTAWQPPQARPRAAANWRRDLDLVAYQVARRAAQLAALAELHAEQDLPPPPPAADDCWPVGVFLQGKLAGGLVLHWLRPGVPAESPALRANPAALARLHVAAPAGLLELGCLSLCKEARRRHPPLPHLALRAGFLAARARGVGVAVALAGTPARAALLRQVLRLRPASGRNGAAREQGLLVADWTREGARVVTRFPGFGASAWDGLTGEEDRPRLSAGERSQSQPSGMGWMPSA
ncbi:MAG: hypothetical protein NTW56_03420 [Alphaproteobacteria bacterium]|nr:hypothetical protein [Alphaproteobacteria bacterium]